MYKPGDQVVSFNSKIIYEVVSWPNNSTNFDGIVVGVSEILDNVHVKTGVRCRSLSKSVMKSYKILPNKKLEEYM